MAEGDTSRIAEGKPKVDMVLPEDGNASGNIYTASGSMGGSGAYLEYV